MTFIFEEDFFVSSWKISSGIRVLNSKTLWLFFDLVLASNQTWKFASFFILYAYTHRHIHTQIFSNIHLWNKGLSCRADFADGFRTWRLIYFNNSIENKMFKSWCGQQMRAESSLFPPLTKPSMEHGAVSAHRKGYLLKLLQRHHAIHLPTLLLSLFRGDIFSDFVQLFHID